MPIETDDLLLRRAFVFASALIYWGGVWVQARRVRRQIGRSPNVAPHSTKERLLWVGWFLVVMGWMVQPFLAGDDALPGLRIHETWIGVGSLLAGVAFLLSGYAGTLWCYTAMGRTWRMGIDRGERTPLVMHGPYRRVRHPIYLFQVVMLVGMLSLLPTMVSLGVLAVHLTCVSFKVADEEAHLRRVHGVAYGDYTARTGRLLPRIW
jgi:protein-S-isoprenylcysteine O-methyltransferase Ste14